jgi:hypothetical protein
MEARLHPTTTACVCEKAIIAPAGAMLCEGLSATIGASAPDRSRRPRLNQADRLGETPLEIAVQWADVEVVRLLVDNGATMRPEVFGHFMLLWRRYPERLKAHAAEMERVLRDAIRRQRPAIPRQGVGF